MEYRSYNLAKIVEKINGNIYPVGESGADKKALENLDQLGDMVNEFVSEIYMIWQRNHSHYEDSRVRAALKANSILKSLEDYMAQNSPGLAEFNTSPNAQTASQGGGDE